MLALFAGIAMNAFANDPADQPVAMNDVNLVEENVVGHSADAPNANFWERVWERGNNWERRTWERRHWERRHWERRGNERRGWERH